MLLLAKIRDKGLPATGYIFQNLWLSPGGLKQVSLRAVAKKFIAAV